MKLPRPLQTPNKYAFNWVDAAIAHMWLVCSKLKKLFSVDTQGRESEREKEVYFHVRLISAPRANLASHTARALQRVTHWFFLLSSAKDIKLISLAILQHSRAILKAESGFYKAITIFQPLTSSLQIIKN
jgi:hypothetical protein